MLRITNVTSARNLMLTCSLLASTALGGLSVINAKPKQETVQVAAYTEGMGGIYNSGYNLLPAGTLGLGFETLSEKGFHSNVNINAGTMINGEITAGYIQQTPNDRIKMDYYGTVAGYYNFVNNPKYPENTDMIVTPMSGQEQKYHLYKEQTLPYKGFNAGAGVKMNSQLDRKGIATLGIGVEAGYHTSAHNVHYHTNWSENSETYTKEVYDIAKYKYPWYVTPKADLLVNMPKGFYGKLSADLYKLKAGFGWKFWQTEFKREVK